MTKKEKIIGVIITLIAIAVVAVVIAKIPPAERVQESTTDTRTQTQATTTTLPDDTTVPTSETETSTTEVTTQPIPEVDYDLVAKNTIIILGTSAMEVYSINDSGLKSYAGIISALAEKCPDVNVYSLIAPTQVEFYGPEEFRKDGHSQKKGIQIAYDAMSDKVIKIDAWSSLAQHTNEYIYFRTDHHWTARGAYYAYLAFAAKAGISNPKPLSEYESGMTEGFVGSMYGFSNKNPVLADNPDTIEYYMPLNNATGQILGVDKNGNLTGQNNNLIIVNPNSSSYAGTFIQGDQALERIVTDNKNGRKILVIKESYGNCFVPFLTESFEEIYVLDPRKDGVKEMSLPSFISETGITDVIAINYSFATSNEKIKGPLSNIVNK